MNTETAKILCKLNTEFYRENSASFAQTRQAPWPGWKHALEAIAQYCEEEPEQGLARFSVFDLACGNLRFETFFKAEYPNATIEAYAVDNCDELVPPDPHTHFQHLDIMNLLLAGESLNDAFAAPLCDLAVSFGFMHHIPGIDHRVEVLKALIRQTKDSGYVVLSFWQFMNNEILKQKALLTRSRAIKKLSEQKLDSDSAFTLELDKGDFLLGWKNLPDTHRYCHSFSEEEIDQLIQIAEEETKAKLLFRYTSDGRGNNLNTYLIFKA